MAEILITRSVFKEAVGLLEKEHHIVDINDSDRILPTQELVKRLLICPQNCIQGKSAL